MDDQSNSSQLALKTVIFATDFSSNSENAGLYASMFARQFHAELLLAHAFVLSPRAMDVETGVTAPAIKSQQRQDLEQALMGITPRYEEGVKHVRTALVDGNPWERIPALAERDAPSLIVLGTSGRGRIDRGVVGSVAEKILRKASQPSVTVGPLVAPFRPASTTIRTVLYATGLSEIAARGASYAVGIANAFQASLEVLHVVREDVRNPEQLSELQGRFHEVLKGIVPEHADSIANPSALIEVGSAHERILKRLKETSADLLVLSIRKSSHLWLQSRLSGAFHIIANAPCPVVTITG